MCPCTFGCRHQQIKRKNNNPKWGFPSIGRRIQKGRQLIVSLWHISSLVNQRIPLKLCWDLGDPRRKHQTAGETAKWMFHEVSCPSDLSSSLTLKRSSVLGTWEDFDHLSKLPQSSAIKTKWNRVIECWEGATVAMQSYKKFFLVHTITYVHLVPRCFWHVGYLWFNVLRTSHKLNSRRLTAELTWPSTICCAPRRLPQLCVQAQKLLSVRSSELNGSKNFRKLMKIELNWTVIPSPMERRDRKQSTQPFLNMMYLQ